MARALSNPVRVSAPLQGVDGRTVLAKARAPLVTDGRIGDFWIDTVAKKLYGPKSAGGWPDNGLIRGAAGWYPLERIVPDGARRVVEVYDWAGGEGAKPATGYKTATGALSVNIADGAEVRGAEGPAMLIDALAAGDDDVGYDDNAAIAKAGDDNERQSLKRLLGAGGLLQFDSVGEAVALVVPASVKAVQINGASPAEGGAGHIRRRVDSEPAIGPKHRSADRFTSDGSSDAANGGWWGFVEDRAFLPAPAVNVIRGIGDKLRDLVHVKDFGAVGDGVTDDTAKIQAAIDAVYARGGGEIDCSGGRWLIDSAELIVKEGVRLVGPHRWYGWRGSSIDHSTTKGAFVINPAYLIRLAEHDSGLSGLVFLRKGMVKPTTLRQGLDFIAAFAGTAVRVGYGPTLTNRACNTYVGHCTFFGFEYAYYCDYSERPTVEYVTGDCKNGILMKNVFDMNHLSHCHFWPYLTGHQPDWSYTSYAISNVVNNGSGLCRVTLAPHGLVTGDGIVVKSVTGTTEANGRWTVTVINSTTVDLQGSVFANAYVSGGVLSPRPLARDGWAYAFDGNVDWGQMDNCFSFGYARGFHVANTNHCELVNCGADHYAAVGDPTTIGFYIGTSTSTKLIGPKAAAQGIGIRLDVGTTNGASVIGWDAWGIIDKCMQVVSGGAAIVGGQMKNGTVAATAGIVINATAEDCVVTGNKARGIAVPIAATGVGLRRLTCWGNSWPDATIGDRLTSTNSAQGITYDYFNSVATGLSVTGRKARGTPDTPIVAQSGDVGISLSGQVYDGANYGSLATLRATARGAPSAGSTAGAWIFATTPTGSASPIDRVILSEAGQFYPVTHNVTNLGVSGFSWLNTYTVNVRPGTAGTAIWTSGAGTPEGAVAAPVGSMYTRSDGGAGTVLYIKETGSGTTGWVAK